MKKFVYLLAATLVVLVLVPQALAQRKEKVDPTIRSVQGVVTNAAGKSVQGAVVQLKNTKTLQIRSFISKDDGTYAFHGLSTNIDYELKAEYQGASSDVKTLSVFNTRRKAVIDLQLNK